MPEKENCWTPCDTETLIKEDLIKTKDPVNIDVKNKLKKQIVVSAIV
jgi:hypothetical protein